MDFPRPRVQCGGHRILPKPSVRIADAATVAPFEYIGLPLAVFWGLVIFGDLPVWEVWVGIGLILGSGLFVFLRERRKLRSRSSHRRGGATS